MTSNPHASLLVSCLATLTTCIAFAVACGSSGSNGPGAGQAGSSDQAGAAGEAGAAANGTPGDAGSSGDSGGEGGEAGGGSEQHMFDELGVKTDRSPRVVVDWAGNSHTLDGSYNPLGRGLKTFQPLTEIYMAGRGIDAAHPNQVLFDDLANGGKNRLPTPLGAIADGDESWLANKYKVSLPVDLNGDGIDEIVNFFWVDTAKELHANVIACAGNCAGNGGNFKKVKESVLTVHDVSQVPTDIDWFRHGFAAADVDGDGKSEIVIVNFGGVEQCSASSSFALSCKTVVPYPSNATHMSVARGHFDNVPGLVNDGVVVAWSDGGQGYVSIYDGTPSAFASNGYTAKRQEATTLAVKFADVPSAIVYSEAFVTAGDLDADGRDEIVLAAHQVGTKKHDLVLIDDTETSYTPFHAFRVSLGSDGGTNDDDNHLFRAALRVFNKTTQPALKKAIYAGSLIIDGFEGQLLDSSTTALSGKQTISNGVTLTEMSYKEGGGGPHHHGPNDVVVGDIDGSGQDSVVAFWDVNNELIGNDSPFTVTTLAVASWDAGSGKWARWRNIASTTGGLTPVHPGGDEGTYDIGLALPNVDHDSAIITFKNQHEVLFSDPQVLAVLAAPPFIEGVNESNSQTSISFGTGKGSEGESTIGVSAGASIGYSAPSLFGLDTASWKLTVSAAFDSVTSHGVELEQTQTWTVGTEDAVVFHVIPFDVYYYEVVDSPVAKDIGNTLTINVPRALNTYKVPVALYNQSILNGPTIGPDVLTHTVGDPSSYPTTNACAKAKPGTSYGGNDFLIDGASWCYASESTLHTGVGTGSVGFEIARSDTFSSGYSQDIAVDFETEVGVGGFTVGSSVGFHYGYSYTVDTTESYNFSGQVGDLPDSKHGYDFGLMVHKGMLAGTNITYPVFLVDYWVQHVE